MNTKVTALDAAIGKRLRDIRREKGLVMAQVAEFLGTTYYSVYLMEKGRQRFFAHTLAWWCVFLKTDEAELLKLALDDVAGASGARTGE